MEAVDVASELYQYGLRVTSTDGTSYNFTASGRPPVPHAHVVVALFRFHASSGVVSIGEVAADGVITDVTGDSSSFTNQVRVL